MRNAEEFAAIVRMPEPPLDRALAAIAAHDRPGVQIDAVLDRLDQLAATCSARDPERLCAELFGPDGFRGDTEDYHDPRNSLLDEVLARRLGIPISLAVVAIEVGRRLGVGLVGIGMPGHYLVRDADDPGAFFDPFRQGAPLDRTACRAVFERLHGPRAMFHDSFLDPTPQLATITRVLANLRHAYMLRADRSGLVRVARLRVRMPDAGIVEQRAFAELLAADGRFDEAAQVHEQLAVTDPERDHAHTALKLRARLN